MNDTQPNTAGCQVCSSPTGDSLNLCGTHTDEVRTQLADVEHLVAELEVTVTRQARTAPDNQGVRSPETPLPWNEAASDAAFVLNTTLNAWSLDVSRIAEDERDHFQPIPYTDTIAVAQWLARNLHTLRQHPEAGTAHNEIINAIREARRAIDRPQDPIPFGECGHIFEDGHVCQEILYGHLDRPHVKCRACATPHKVANRLEWMLGHIRGMLGTIPELVVFAHLAGKRTSEDKLRLMASRGRFLAVGSKGSLPTYRVADVLKAIDERYKHRPKVAGAA